MQSLIITALAATALAGPYENGGLTPFSPPPPPRFPIVKPAVAAPKLPGYTYLGCKIDSVSARLLPQKYTYAKNMTLGMCAKTCGANYEFIGLEYSQECFCGSALPLASLVGQPGRAANETECGMTCGGSAEKCGGASRISVFKQTVFRPSIPPPVKGYAYRGCYADSVGKRILKDAFLYGKNMTTTSCAAACSKSTYFGTEYGGECFCGNTLSLNATRVPADQCKAACAGGSKQSCGDAYRMNLYWKINAKGARRAL